MSKVSLSEYSPQKWKVSMTYLPKLLWKKNLEKRKKERKKIKLGDISIRKEKGNKSKVPAENWESLWISQTLVQFSDVSLLYIYAIITVHFA